MATPYNAINHPEAEPTGSICYLCGNPKLGKLTQDHVIPQSFFNKGCEHRPYLTVHHRCNNGKSLDDEKFVIRMQLMCNLNASAQRDVSPFLILANEEAENAYLVGKSKHLRNYKLKRTIAKEFRSDFEIVRNGEHIVQVRVSDKHMEAMSKYANVMARGLFVRNVPGATPDISKVKFLWQNYYLLHIHKKLHEQMELVKHTIEGAHLDGTLFCQSWKGLIEYYGAKTNEAGSSGFVYMKFYDEIGIWVHFASDEELAMAKGA